jgi:hypothetical protein
LYIEIPEASSAAVLAWSEALSGCPMPSMPGQSFHIAMIGYDLASNRVEFYHRSVDLLPTALGLLLRRAGLEHRSREMFDLLQRAYRFPLASRLPARDVGFSYSMPLSGKDPIAFTLYFYCRSLFGGDDAARARLLKLASEYKWNLSQYASATGSMRPTAANRVHHGMFGVGLAENQPMAISVGIAPQIHPGGNPLQ